MSFFKTEVVVKEKSQIPEIIRLIHTDGSGVIDIPMEAGTHELYLFEEDIILLEKNGFHLEVLEDLQKRFDLIKDNEAADELFEQFKDIPSDFHIRRYMNSREIRQQVETIISKHNKRGFMTLIDWNSKKTIGAYNENDPTPIDKKFGQESLWHVRITDGDYTHKPVIFILANLHGNELITPLIALNLINTLVLSKDPLVQKLMQNFCFVIVPLCNPDGHNYALSKNVGWRKNRNIAHFSRKQSVFGIDNNRNFPTYFNHYGSSSSANSGVYRGPSQISEVENEHLEYIMSIYKNIKLSIDLHTPSNANGHLIFRPGPHLKPEKYTDPTESRTRSVPPFAPISDVTEQDHETIAKILEKHLSKAVGSNYSRKGTGAYSGTIDEYTYHLFNPCYSYSIECTKDGILPDFAKKAVKIIGDLTKGVINFFQDPHVGNQLPFILPTPSISMPHGHLTKKDDSDPIQINGNIIIHVQSGRNVQMAKVIGVPENTTDPDESDYHTFTIDIVDDPFIIDDFFKRVELDEFELANANIIANHKTKISTQYGGTTKGTLIIRTVDAQDVGN